MKERHAFLFYVLDISRLFCLTLASPGSGSISGSVSENTVILRYLYLPVPGDAYEDMINKPSYSFLGEAAVIRNVIHPGLL